MAIKKKVTKKKVAKKTTKKTTQTKKIAKKKATKNSGKAKQGATTEPTPKPKRRRKTNYLNNADLLAETIKSKETGQMTDKLAHMLVTLIARYGKKSNFSGYCVDSDTEALTVKGWKNYNQLSLSDKILSYDINTKELVWSDIKDIYINENYNGPMHKLDTQGMDALVTPNHKFVSTERGIVPVEDITCNEHVTLTGSPVNAPKEPKYSDSFVEVVGWAITEGHYIKRSVIDIYQKEGPLSDRIRSCLNKSGISFREHNFKGDLITFSCTGKDICMIFDTVAPNKVLTSEFILSLTQPQRLLLINTMADANGWHVPGGGWSYIQKDPDHVDAFLMLCTLSGLTTSTTKRVYDTPKSRINPEGGKSEVLTTHIYKTPKLHCKSEEINFHGGRATPGGRRKQKSNIPTQQYNGTTWCPQTEYGTFVCRRGKYIYVTGNTYNDDMQGYASMMLVKTWDKFNPEKSSNAFAFFTQCVKNSFIQFLKQERRQRDIRDEVLVSNGLNPSFTFTAAYEEQQKNRTFAHDEQDYNANEKQRKEIEKQEKGAKESEDILEF